MRNYTTFDIDELRSVITSMGLNLHRIADDITYFKQYAKIHGVKHDSVPDGAIEKINDVLKVLRNDFNLPKEPNCCLDQYSKSMIKEVTDRAIRDHDNPHRMTASKINAFIEEIHLLSELKGEGVDWDRIKIKCASILMQQ